MPLITERPPAPLDESRQRDGSYSYRSQRVIEIGPDVADYAAARAALAAYGVEYNQPYDSNFPDAVVIGIAPQFNRVNGVYTFTVTYGDGGGDGFLAQPPKVRYEPYDISYPTDRSPVNLIPWQNTVGTPFADYLTQEDNGVMVTVTVPRPNYGFAGFLPYRNRINSVPILLPDGNTIPARLARFRLSAMTDRSTSAENCYVEIKLDVRPGPVEGTSGWDRHVIDQGGELWAVDDVEDEGGEFGKFKGPATFATAGSSAVANVLLNGAGRPIKSAAYKVADAQGRQYEVTDPPAGPPEEEKDLRSPSRLLINPLLTTYDPESEDETGIVVLSFPMFFEADLNDLLT